MKLLKTKIYSKLISLNFYKVTLKPILKNYSHYLASFLRSFLFFSTEGCGITEIKIYGVESEFDNIPGVKENVSNLILNLKSVIFRIKKKKVIIYLNKIGPAIIRASDFYLNEWFDILNPDCVICSLAKDFSLNITIKVEKGIGYFSIDNDNYNKKKDLDGILVDVNFSPIKRVYYKIKKRNLFNKIIFFIETNGVISPKKIFIKSISILLHQLSNFNLMNNKFQCFNKNLFKKISDIDSDPNFLYYMNKLNIVYLGDLIKFDKKKLLKISSMNFSFLKKVNLILLKYNLHLNTNTNKLNFNKKKYIKYETFKKKK